MLDHEICDKGLESMKRILPPTIFVLILCLGCAGSAFGANYYISTSGSDTNNGTSESTPWAHLPGMVTWTGKHTPVAGDTFVLRGCDVWPNASFSVLWSWSGTGASPIVIGGEDTTWYNTTNCPSGWNRPIFDAGLAAIPTQDVVFFFKNGATGVQYVNLDNIEMRGLYNSGQGSYGALGYIGCYEACQNLHYTHLYLHEWSVATDGNCVLVEGQTTSPYFDGSSFDYGVIDGADATPDTSCYAFYAFPTVTHSVIQNIPNAILYIGHGEIGYNTINNITTSNNGTHENAIESLGVDGSGTFYIHDNVISNMAVGEGGQVCFSGETDYLWNNTWVLTGGGNAPAIPYNGGSATSCTAVTMWNNTIVPQSGVNCVHKTGASGSTIGTLTIQNNHCVTTGSLNDSFSGVATTQIINSNTLMTPTTATSQGYTSSETLQYSPPSGCTPASCSTLQAGANLTSSWPAGYSTNDTTYACIEQTINGVVQSFCPARAATTRQGTGGGNWDVGAYYYVASEAPQPPTGLAAVVH